MNEIKKEYSFGMIFGVFDGLHPGHVYFVNEALKKCEHLTVVVEILKKKTPKYSLEERMSRLKKLNENLSVIPGDKMLGEWTVLKENRIDIVFLGYDQQGIARELDKMTKPYIFLPAYYPEKYKSSLYEKNEDIVY